MNILAYTLSDLLMFAPENYARLIQTYNQNYWPLHILMLLLGALIVWNIIHPNKYQRQIIMTSLALSWIWVGYGFHYLYYSTINWFAFFYALTFFTQGMILLSYGLFKSNLSFKIAYKPHHYIGTFFILTGLIFYPLISLLNHGLHHVEIFGMLSPPTLITTCGIVLLSKNSPSLFPILIPLVSSMVASLTGWAIGSYEVMITLFVSLATMILIFHRKLFE